MDEKQCGDLLMQTISSGFVTMAIAIGRESGLFKILCESKTPMTIKDIASSACLKARYVQEWLGCMVASKFINLDPSTQTYYVPDSHKSVLLSPITHFAGGMIKFAQRHDHVMECLPENGPYGFDFEKSFFSWFGRFREVEVDATIDDEILPNLNSPDFIESLKSGVRVLDLACGPGNFTEALAKKFPNSHFLGVDFAKCAIETAKKRTNGLGYKNIEFEEGDAMNLNSSWTEKFEWVFLYDALHDFPDPKKALSEIYRVLKPGGMLTLTDEAVHSKQEDNVGQPYAALNYSVSMYLCLPSSLGHPPHVGYGACWGVEEVEKALVASNFVIAKKQLIEGDCAALFQCSKKI